MQWVQQTDFNPGSSTALKTITLPVSISMGKVYPVCGTRGWTVCYYNNIVTTSEATVGLRLMQGLSYSSNNLVGFNLLVIGY